MKHKQRAPSLSPFTFGRLYSYFGTLAVCGDFCCLNGRFVHNKDSVYEWTLILETL